MTENKLNVAINHVLSIIKPTALCLRVNQYIGFSHAHPKDSSSGFMKHCIDLLDAFEQFDCSPSKSRKTKNNAGKRNNDKHGGQKGLPLSGAGVENDFKLSKINKPPPEPCLLLSFKGKNGIHRISDCDQLTEEENETYLDKQAVIGARHFLSRSTRSQTAEASKSVKCFHYG